MKLISIIFLALIIANNAPAQDANIAKSLGMYVFPAKDQNKEQQDLDEFSCYKWAMQQTGYDPMNPTKVTPQEAESHGGTAVRTAAKGAAMGAAIGAIAGDAGKGAAIGAASGGFLGVSRRAHADAASQQQAEAAAKQQELAMLNDYKKAFSVCLEGKGYTVK